VYKVVAHANQRAGVAWLFLFFFIHLDRFAELVFPLLPLKTREKLTQPHLTGPFGEIIANNYVPEVKTPKALVKEEA
jgi:hypothetical protein